MRMNTVSTWSSRVCAVATLAERAAATSARNVQRARRHSSSRVPTVSARPHTHGMPSRADSLATSAAARPAARPVPWSNVATVNFRRDLPGRWEAAVRRAIESIPPDTASTTRGDASSAAATARSTTGASTRAIAMILLIYLLRGEFRLETHGPLGTLWVSIGLIAFYIALTWLNALLGLFLTPLFLVPGTWLLDWRKKRKAAAQDRAD